jgi:hypothetical protein
MFPFLIPLLLLAPPRSAFLLIPHRTISTIVEKDTVLEINTSAFAINSTLLVKATLDPLESKSPYL